MLKATQIAVVTEDTVSEEGKPLTKGEVVTVISTGTSYWLVQIPGIAGTYLVDRWHLREGELPKPEREFKFNFLKDWWKLVAALLGIAFLFWNPITRRIIIFILPLGRGIDDMIVWLALIGVGIVLFVRAWSRRQSNYR